MELAVVMEECCCLPAEGGGVPCLCRGEASPGPAQPAAPAPEQAKSPVFLAAAAAVVAVLPPVPQDCAAVPSDGRVCGRTHNQNQALLCIWRT
jgi:hypothetical protein